MRIAIIGLGKMGSAMALRLIECGHELVVWNRSAAKAQPLLALGACLADSARAAVLAADVTISSLFDAKVLREIYLGDGGIASGDLSGKLLIEMSTVRPHVEVELAAAISARGGALIDCPVGGTTGPAKQGKLLGLVGGAEPDVARAMPILNQLCRRVEHIGPVGAGSAMKLAINLPLAVYWQALGESVALVRHLGKDPAWLVDLFNDTSGGNNALKIRGPAVAAALAGGDGGMATFDLGGIAKDLGLMLEEARSRGFDLPLAARAEQIYAEAVAEGHAGKDTCWVPSYWAAKTDAPQMPQRLTLARAQLVVEAALTKGRDLGLAPLTVAVLDAGGHLVAFLREDKSGIMRHDIAFGKAWGALGMGFGSRELFTRSQINPSFVAALSSASNGRLIPAPGGVLIKAEDGVVLGAVGISGDTSDNDEACCLAGIAAAGFAAQMGA